MKSKLPEPLEKAMIYEDSKLYVCLANYPITKGHVVVVWKKDIKDLHLLEKSEYEYLMDKVDEVRNVMMEVLGVDKVYLIYMDEVEQVHWHLVPRYDEKGFNVFKHKPEKLSEFRLAENMSEKLSFEKNF